jgi:hypothetical protein
MRSLVLILSLLVTSCITPDNWKPEEHQKMMMRCYVMCKKTGAAGYDAWTAECSCNKRKYND